MAKTRKVVVNNKEELIKIIDTVGELQKSLGDGEAIDIIVGRTGNATLHLKVTRYYTRLLVNKNIRVRKDTIADVMKALQMLQNTEVGRFLLEKFG
jgi:RNase P/RNase MRP subunit POP5